MGSVVKRVGMSPVKAKLWTMSLVKVQRVKLNVTEVMNIIAMTVRSCSTPVTPRWMKTAISTVSEVRAGTWYTISDRAIPGT